MHCSVLISMRSSLPSASSTANLLCHRHATKLMGSPVQIDTAPLFNDRSSRTLSHLYRSHDFFSVSKFTCGCCGGHIKKGHNFVNKDFSSYKTTNIIFFVLKRIFGIYSSMQNDFFFCTKVQRTIEMEAPVENFQSVSVIWYLQTSQSNCYHYFFHDTSTWNLSHLCCKQTDLCLKYGGRNIKSTPLV